MLFSAYLMMVVCVRPLPTNPDFRPVHTVDGGQNVTLAAHVKSMAKAWHSVCITQKELAVFSSAFLYLSTPPTKGQLATKLDSTLYRLGTESKFESPSTANSAGAPSPLPGSVIYRPKFGGLDCAKSWRYRLKDMRMVPVAMQVSTLDKQGQIHEH